MTIPLPSRPASPTAPPATFLGSRDFAPLLESLDLTCLDLGARGGITSDVLPLAPWVDAIGFEPDPSECTRLNGAAMTGKHPWKSLRYIPVALGQDGADRSLRLYRQRGCSSLLDADLELTRAFARDDYFILDDTAPVTTVGLDVAAERFGFTGASYMKLDIQGTELEVLQTAPKLLERSLLAIRCEVEFLPIYTGQPLFSDVEMYMRDFGFLPMTFVKMEHWRLGTKVKHPAESAGPIPYSRGIMAHGDVLFFRSFLSPAVAARTEPMVLMQAAFLALTHELADYAAMLFQQPHVAEYIASHYDIELRSALHKASLALARRHRQRGWVTRLRQAKHKLQQAVRRT